VSNGTIPIASPSGLIFVGPTPAAQQISIFNSTGGSISFTSTHVTDDGQNWCSPSPVSGTIGQNQSSSITVQANVSALSPAVRQCTLKLAFGDGSVQTIQIASINTPGISTSAGASISSSLGSNELRPEVSCGPTKLVLEFISPVLRSNFTVAAGDGVSVQVQAKDDCGKPMITGGMLVTFTGETLKIPPMSQQGNGVWATTWLPSGGTTRSVTATATAFSGTSVGILEGQVVANGTVTAKAAPRAASPAAAVNSASYQDPGQSAPGTFVSIFGSQLASAQASGTLPLPCQLSDAQVFIGASCLPVQYVSDPQVNAVLPLGLPSNTIQHLVIQRGATQSFPIDVTITDQLPGIYTVSQNGAGQGEIVNGITNILADPKAPVSSGRDVITIYCTGLGQVDNPPPDGQPAPLLPLANTLVTPVVMIGGVPSPILFSGLAPGFAGLYQVNAKVPAGIQPGSAVPVTITMGGITSNTATIAIQ
jgi:uncharacterized protein (TIGR03437 family)